jgi:CO dehydrogenase maturation factor
VLAGDEEVMSFQIALAGKGGTGKTTVASMVIRYLLEKGMTPVLAVDADANANLNEMLGVEVAKTLGEARETMKASVPTGMTKETFMEYKVQEALIEREGFDLIVMGRPEGSGCYCYANVLLTKYLDVLLKNYRFTVVDNEAGLEHISRLTTKDVDLMLIVTDPTKRGVLTAERIRDLTRDLSLNIGNMKLVVNRCPGELDPKLKSEIDAKGLELGGVIPADENVAEFDLEGRALFELPSDSPSLVALSAIMAGIFFGTSEGSKEAIGAPS